MLTDAWMSRTMSIHDRILSAMRARFFLHMWRQHIVTLSKAFPDLYSTSRSFISAPAFNILNRLCDTLPLLALVFSTTYPNQPFCPWVFGTEFVEHFFGQARMLLPDFSYAELVKMVQHVMLRQRLLLFNRFKEKRQKEARVGYLVDIDTSPLSEVESRLLQAKLTPLALNQLVELGFREAMLICRQILHIPVASPTQDSPVPLAPLFASKIQQKAEPTKPSASKLPHMAGSEEHGDSDGLTDNDSLHDSASILDHDESYDLNSASQHETLDPDSDFTSLAALSAQGTARYSALCDDVESLITSDHHGDIDIHVESAHQQQKYAPTVANPNSSAPSEMGTPTLNSHVLGLDSNVSVVNMVKSRQRFQSGTTTRSECIIQLNPKFSALGHVQGIEQQATKVSAINVYITALSDNITQKEDSDTRKKATFAAEAAHRTRIQQSLHADHTKQKKTREFRWKRAAQALQKVLPDVGAQSPTLHSWIQ